MRVVQIEPGPMPTLTASAPASISALRAVGGRDVAGHDAHRVGELLDARHRVEHALRMAVRGVDDEQVDAGIDQPLGALEAVVADAGGGGDAQAALRVLGGVRVELRLLDVLDGDQADAVAVAIDDQQLLDAVLVQQALGLVLVDALLDRDEVLAGHQLVDLLRRVGGEAHVAVGQDADQPAGLWPPAPPFSTTGMPEMPCVRISASASASVASGPIVTGLTTMPDSNFLTWRTCSACSAGERLRWMTPMPPACAMAMASRASVTVSMAAERIGMLSSMSPAMRVRDIGLAGHDLGMAGLQQHVVEGERQCAGCRFDDLRHGQPSE